MSERGKGEKREEKNRTQFLLFQMGKGGRGRKKESHLLWKKNSVLAIEGGKKTTSACR